ncbi:BREX-1 system adenine-specific DNA-methyltransferase PglX, partial [Lachnoanaerobaculum gingivalis]|uniref:BREX-1 system adenine-specific DNA-methyltransferase PglX n=1 Tax=Lachnoanaerobaculum gingivalis TaxID=2490855 RepID=UPI0028D015C9
MNKTAIKNFAIWARNKLIADISYRAGLMGITAEGISAALPQSDMSTEFYDIGTENPYSISGDVIKQRRKLVEVIRRKEEDTDYQAAYKYIIEEVAYTWFNRLIAIRFMEVNDYLPSHIRVLSSETGKLEPDIVTNPFDAELEFTDEEREKIIQLKTDNQLDELFRILFIKQCNALNEYLPALFEKTNDYTELLLNISVIDQDGVVYKLVHDISEDDFNIEKGGQVEIIGWLYQYYNTEPKAEVFGRPSGTKIRKEDVPAATQLFTPDWIVRYMVENSLGRLWVEGHPNEEIKANWKYYLEEAKQEPEVEEKLAEIRKEYAKLNPEDIKLIDPCMGSGHILVYAFDVLMQIYESAGYGQRDAAGSILENNIYGLDIDDRAFQLAYFAVMMKARQYNRRILTGEYKLNLYSIKESNGVNRAHIKYFGMSLSEADKEKAVSQTNSLLDTFIDAKEYGSILTVEEYDWELLERFIEDSESSGQISMETVGIEDTKESLLQMIAQGKVLGQKYWVAVTNPPYAGSGNLSDRLNRWIKIEYENSKSDLSTVFMERINSMMKNTGYMAMINIPVWMFLTSYRKLRESFLHKNTYINMLHLGRGIFGSDFGTTSFVVEKGHISGYYSTYRRLFDKQGSVETVEEKEHRLLSGKGQYVICQDNLVKIPGIPMAYWASSNFISAFNNKKLSDFCFLSEGIHSRNNEEFLRVWYEVDFSRSSLIEYDSGKKWYPCNKGGSFRKWYGNNEYVINWENDGQHIKEFKKASIGSDKYRFKDGITFTTITSAERTFRYSPEGYLYDMAGPTFFMENKEYMFYILAAFSSKLGYHFLSAINPGVSLKLGEVNNFPIIVDERYKSTINNIAIENIHKCKVDWDSFETSWDFSCHPFIKKNIIQSVKNKNYKRIEECYKSWSNESDKNFDQLKANEEEINRIFIDIYCLGDELVSEIDEKDVTVRRANLKRDIKSLLSYAVGCMFGRYSLDTEGLAYAGGEWDESKYDTFKPDDDNIIPITDEEYLEDDIIVRLCTWLKVVYGEDTLDENLDFIAKALGNKGNTSREIIRNYFLNDFFKDHCQTYSVTGSGKRPIYWLFDSGKQNGFKALIYLHRYNADTIGNLRIDYLHRMQRIYESESIRMQDTIDHSTNAREVATATKRREKLQKQL